MFDSHMKHTDIIDLASGFLHGSVCLISYADEAEADAMLDDPGTIGEVMEQLASPCIMRACSLTNLPAVLEICKKLIEHDARELLGEVDDTAGSRLTVEWLDEGWDLTADFDRTWAEQRIRLRITGESNLAGILTVQVQSIIQPH